MNRCWECCYCIHKDPRTMMGDCVLLRMGITAEAIACEKFVNANPSLRSRNARYRMKFKNDQVSRYTERLYKAGYARGYSEGLEKGLSLYRQAAAEIREIISEGGKE